MPALHEQWHDAFPRLTPTNYRETSPTSWSYNCIAWSAGVTDAWWWPAPGRFWPDKVPREETIAAFLAVFATLGYQPDATLDLVSGVEKVALYANGGNPTHAARQLGSGMWTSNLGPFVDIEHDTPDAVAGGLYGEVVAILSRKQPHRDPPTTTA